MKKVIKLAIMVDQKEAGDGRRGWANRRWLLRAENASLGRRFLLKYHVSFCE